MYVPRRCLQRIHRDIALALTPEISTFTNTHHSIALGTDAVPRADMLDEIEQFSSQVRIAFKNLRNEAIHQEQLATSALDNSTGITASSNGQTHETLAKKIWFNKRIGS